MTLFEDDTRKVPWASELFEQGTHRLKEPVYLWVKAWNQGVMLGRTATMRISPKSNHS